MLVITGALCSDNPTQRFLLIKNQTLVPGCHVTPERTLEEIRQRSSVFSFQGMWFCLTH